jgi:hypothetical protein
MVWKVLWNRFHRQRKKKRRDASKGDPEAILTSSSLQAELIPSQYVLLSDALDDNPVVLIGKEEAFGDGANRNRNRNSNSTDTCTTTASQPALISPDSTEASHGKWVSRWDNVSEDISGSFTADSPIPSHHSPSPSRTSKATSSSATERASTIDTTSSTSTSTASESTTTTTPIPQLLTFVEKRPQHVLNTNPSSRTIHSHSTCTNAANDSITTSHLSTTSIRAVPLIGTDPNPNNTSTRSAFSHMTNTTANSTTTSDTANTLVSSLYITPPSSNSQQNAKYDCHTVPEEEEDDDGVEDLEILRRICCSVNPKELVHIMGEQYSCLLVDDQMKSMVQKMLHKQQQQEETLVQQNHNQNHIDAITTRIQTEEQMEHLGFEAELLK